MSRREKRAVRKIYSSRVSRQEEEDEENIPIAQLRNRQARQEPGSNSTNMRGNLEIKMGNTYLFRDDNAYCNYIAFCKRPQADCYCFVKNGDIQGDWESQKVEDYCNKWGWKPLLECNDPYHEVIVRAFYANIIKYSKNQEPWGFRTYVCGREIEMTVPNIASWLGLVDDGEQVYFNKTWFKDKDAPTPQEYQAWFGILRTDTNRDRPFYATILPSLHRLGYAFLTHILTPKGGKKTNIEYNQMFYLRHLIDGEDRMFNLPFVIISHMLAAFSDSQRILPYGNIIAKILRANGIVFESSPDLIWPQNLWDHLDSHGWDLVETDPYIGTKTFKRKGTPVNQWIAKPNALPNQYWDPSRDQPQSQAQESGSSSQPGYSNEFQKLVLEGLENLRVSHTQLAAKCDQIINTQAKHTEEIERMKANNNGFNTWAQGNYRNLYDEFQKLKSRVIMRFGPDDDNESNANDDNGEEDDGGDDNDDDPMEP